MEAPTLFVGLVTHEGTTFPRSRSADGLAAATQRLIPGSVVREEAEDLWRGEDPGKAEIRACRSAERDIERRWLSYLAAPATHRMLMRARHLRGSLRDRFAVDSASVTRLLNIELSHRSLWGAALDSGAPWVLILEDDGWTDDVDDFASGVQGLMQEPVPPAFVNLSSSFSKRQLHIEHLLRVGRASWHGTRPRIILEFERPVTNTVCAVLYSAEFLRYLVSAWDTQPLFPVVPIDWKLNRILIEAYEAKSFPTQGCWFVEPGPVIQGSMRSPGRMAG